jgi:predicted enzyme related to lactoylglutathione lyase
VCHSAVVDSPHGQALDGGRVRTSRMGRSAVGRFVPRALTSTMSSLVLNVTFDCRDAGAVARFWAEVTGYPKEQQHQPGNDYWVVGPPDGSVPRLVFVTVPEKKSTKNRLHLDVMPSGSSQEEEVARLLDLGASVVDDRRRSSPGGWIVMADPEGNEFCVEHPPD